MLVFVTCRLLSLSATPSKPGLTVPPIEEEGYVDDDDDDDEDDDAAVTEHREPVPGMTSSKFRSRLTNAVQGHNKRVSK
jgi:hypothetical protein